VDNDDARRLQEEPREADPKDKRDPFEHDRSRIVHSSAFRRLQGKTQVYGFGSSDFYRSRLTHTLEVAQIGNGLALDLDANPSLVEAICLGHDIGHPPYGHAGEKALDELLKEHDGFNANAQNIRIVTYLERKSPKYEGLNLTVATLDGITKYPEVLPPGEGKKGYYKTDERLVRSFKPHLVRTFECQLMNWADDVAYSAHDLEDAIIIGTIGLQELASESIRDKIVQRAITAYTYEWPTFVESEPLTAEDAEQLLNEVVERCLKEPASSRSDRIKVLKSFMSWHIHECVTQVEIRKSTIEAPERYTRDLWVPPRLAKRVELFKAIPWVCVIKSTPVVTLQHAGRRVVSDLFKAFSFKSHESLDYDLANLYPIDWQADCANAVATDIKNDDHERRFQVKQLARDYVGSMTDAQAESIWRRLYMPEGGPLFTAKL